VADARAAEVPAPVAGTTGRTEYPQANRADDFEQAGLLYRVMKADERTRLIANIAGHLGGARREIQARQVQHFVRADGEYGARVARALGLPVGREDPEVLAR
jgi:catalase